MPPARLFHRALLICTHWPTLLGQYFQAFDGVTTTLELEAGFNPIENYGNLISDTPLISYGASAGYVAMRMLVKMGYVWVTLWAHPVQWAGKAGERCRQRDQASLQIRQVLINAA